MAHSAAFRTDPNVPAFDDSRPIIVFDGKCVLCTGSARFVLKRDRKRVFRLLAAQTPLGEALYRHFRLDPNNYETMILIEDGRAWLRSDGALRIVAKLGVPWSLLSAARIVPRSWRDALYGVIARNRIKWFGARETCYLPGADEADRFL